MDNFYVYALSSIEHIYKHKHLCTPKTRQMKMRVGVILDGTGIFTYVNQKVFVQKGDIIIIPEKIFCYSEWIGKPDIRVIYLSFKLNTDNTLTNYNLQTFSFATMAEQADMANTVIEIHNMLHGDRQSQLVAYSKFYMLLSKLLPIMENGRKKYKKELCEAITYITDNWNHDFKFSDVATYCCACEAKLYRLFKEQLGQSPNDYLNSIKVNYAIQYLESAEYLVNEVSYMCNFHSETYFRKVFRKYIGITPSEYKKQFSSM